MFSFFAMLMSWRLSGVWLHEWIGIALIVMIVAHLVVHWGWVEARVSLLTNGSERRFGALLLNTAVFAAMGATIVSGLVVSKVVVPNRLTPQSYLHWHGLHESAATFTAILLGLHLAFNWDRIRGAVRRAFAPRHAEAHVGRRLTGATVLRRLVWIGIASSVLTSAVWVAVRLTPSDGKVMFVHADGRRELAAPPPEITKLMPGQLRPAPAQGAPRLVFSLALVLVAGVVGRRLLTMRRGRRRDQRRQPRAPESPVNYSRA